MGRDRSMDGRTPERIDDRARRDVEAHRYSPPLKWIPGDREKPGSEAREIYDGSHDFYSGEKDK